MTSTASAAIKKAPGYRRIATEEAWAPRELLKLYRRVLAERSLDDPGFYSLWGFFAGGSERARALIERIQDLEGIRLSDMDATGIDQQIVSLTAPGVQIFDAPTATQLGDTVQRRTCRSHPPSPNALCRACGHRPAGSGRRRQRTRTRGQAPRPQGCRGQFAHLRRISRRCEILGHFCCLRSAGRAALSASDDAVEGHDRALSGARA